MTNINEQSISLHATKQSVNNLPNEQTTYQNTTFSENKIKRLIGGLASLKLQLNLA
jgi:hypothetical protein